MRAREILQACADANGGACDSGCGAACPSRPDVRRYFGLPQVRELMERAGADAGVQGVIRDIVMSEWSFFDDVAGLEGRARCQDDAQSFFIYRTAQHLSFPGEVLPLVAREHAAAREAGRNLVEEKYARMMCATDPARYAHTWAPRLGEPSPVKAAVLGELGELLRPLARDAACELPRAQEHARVRESRSGEVSALDYFLAEVASYGLGTLYRLRDALECQVRAGANPIVDTYVRTVALDQVLEV